MEIINYPYKNSIWSLYFNKNSDNYLDGELRITNTFMNELILNVVNGWFPSKNHYISLDKKFEILLRNNKISRINSDNWVLIYNLPTEKYYSEFHLFNSNDNLSKYPFVLNTNQLISNPYHGIRVKINNSENWKDELIEQIFFNI